METNVLHYISYGVYVIASVKDGLFNGQIANSLVQVATRPAPVLVVSINKKNLTHEYIAKSGVFSVSILERDTPLRLIGKFGFKSGREEQKFKDTKYEVLPSGCPVVIENALCYLDTKVTNSVDCGEYTLFLAEVAGMKLLKNGEVLTYSYYHEVKSGATPETAPTFIEGEARKRAADLYPKYRCTVCSYVYNPAVGDPDGGVPPGTPFEKIPFDWTCPICGVGKNKFERMETNGESV